jgi:ornithine cyclodeaminase
VGTSLPNGSEVDATTRLRSNSVIVEWKPQSLLEAGEIVQGLEDHSLDMERIIDLPQMLATKISWRNLSKGAERLGRCALGGRALAPQYSAGCA